MLKMVQDPSSNINFKSISYVYMFNTLKYKMILACITMTFMKSRKYIQNTKKIIIKEKLISTSNTCC